MKQKTALKPIETRRALNSHELVLQYNKSSIRPNGPTLGYLVMMPQYRISVKWDNLYVYCIPGAKIRHYNLQLTGFKATYNPH